MSIRKNYTCIILFVFFSRYLCANYQVIEKIGKEQGLSDHYILSICYFNPYDTIKKDPLPSVKITGFAHYSAQKKIVGKMINKPFHLPVQLQYDENTVSINFSVMDYALKNRVEYAYQLKGANETWYQTFDETQVTFHNLPPGNYLFQVKARIRNQEWSEITGFQIKILPPFWLSWWAKSMYVLTIACGILFIICFYKRKLNLENQLYLEKQNYLQEQHMNEERLHFYTNIAHELRTPLTLIIGPLGDLLEDKQLQPRQTQKISLIRKNALRLSNLIKQMLEFRKSETNNRTLQVNYGNIATAIRDITLNYKELNQNNKISVEFFSEHVSPVYFDREVLTIILDNLISNALKFTAQGSISVTLKEIIIKEISYTEIEVKDTGCGIPPEEQLRIFDRYYRAKANRHTPGSGIGLALVKNLVKLHEGTISVSSKENTGTTFSFRLKTNNSYPNALHIREELKGENKKDLYPLLLIVEDNEEIREYIADAFSDTFEIIEAANGQEGISLATVNIPDIIISDIMMPVMDGYKLCKTLKEDIRTSHIPIILLTVKDTEKDKTAGYAVGADSYITKPFTAHMVKTRARNLLESREKMAGYFSTHRYKKNKASGSLTQLDNEFIEKIISVIEDNMSSTQISISFLSEQLNMSYSAFSKKMKAVTGLTANEFIRKIKMNHAEQLLLSGKYNISEIAYQTGYNSMAYFREAFKAEFGLVPSRYISGLKTKN